MTRRSLEVGGSVLTVSPLEPPTADCRRVALMTINVTDETTSRAPLAALSARLEAPLAGALVRVVENGLVGVSGKPAAAFPTSFPVTDRIAVRLSAPRFLTRVVDVRFAVRKRALTAAPSGTTLTLSNLAGLKAGTRLLIGAPGGDPTEICTVQSVGPAGKVTTAAPLSTSYPIGSTVQPLPADQAIGLRPEPVMVAGRVGKRVAGSLTPLPGATVSLAKLWRQSPAVGANDAPEPPVPGTTPPPPFPAPIAAIRPPLYVDMAGGAAVHIEDRPTDAGFADRWLAEDLAAGSASLLLNEVGSVLKDQLLAIDDDDSDRREILKVSADPSPAAGLARIKLDHPTQGAHRAGRIVRRLGAPGGGAGIPLNYDGAAGDPVLLLDTTGVAGTHQIRIDDPPVESYHWMTVYSAVTDADGFFRLPALTRAGRISLNAKDGGSSASADVEIVPDYRLPVNQLDFIVG